MPIPLRSYRGALRPQWPMAINADQSTAHGLLVAYVGDGLYGRYDPIRLRHGSLTASPRIAGIPNVGSGLYCTGGASLDIPSAWPVTSERYSWRLVFTPRTWTGGFTAVLDGPSRQFSLFFDTSGNGSFLTGPGGFMATGVGLTSGSRWDLVVTNSNDTDARTWVNGRQVGAALPDDPGLGAVTETLSFGRNASGGGTDSDLVFESFQVWDRTLTAGEIWQLYDPATRWDLYRVPSTRVFFDVGGAALRRFFLT